MKAGAGKITIGNDMTGRVFDMLGIFLFLSTIGFVVPITDFWHGMELG